MSDIVPLEANPGEVWLRQAREQRAAAELVSQAHHGVAAQLFTQSARSAALGIATRANLHPHPSLPLRDLLLQLEENDVLALGWHRTVEATHAGRVKRDVFEPKGGMTPDEHVSLEDLRAIRVATMRVLRLAEQMFELDPSEMAIYGEMNP